MERLFHNVSALNIFAATAVFLPMLAYGSTFIKLWVGAEFNFAYRILVVLVLVFFCRFVRPSSTDLVGPRKSSTHSRCPINWLRNEYRILDSSYTEIRPYWHRLW